MDALYEKMKIPESCRIGKRVYKRLFHENAKLGATDKKALRDDVDAIFWQFTFKPSTIAIQPYGDDEREYHEAALLQVNLKQPRRVNRLAEVVHRAIPYPLIVVFAFEGACAVSMAHKRFSRAEKEAIVAEGFQITDWLAVSHPTEIQAAFLESLDISAWPHTHFFAFYKAGMNRVVALACAGHSGRFSMERPPGLSYEGQVKRLKQIEALQQEVSELQGKLKKEKNLGAQVQLNIRFKRVRDQIAAIKAELQG